MSPVITVKRVVKITVSLKSRNLDNYLWLLDLKFYKLVKKTSQAGHDTRKFSSIPKFLTTVE